MAQDFSHYLLVLSYAPDFCAQPTGRKDPRECSPGRKLGFIVHGLWPQNDNGRGPENCSGSPVSRSIIQATLPYIPVDSLIQHEWRTHGTCSGLTSADYFAALRKARDSIQIPADLNQPGQSLTLTQAQIQAKLAAANPHLPAGAIALSCYRDNELQEIRICLNKDLTPRPCGASAAHCTAPKLTLLPAR
jgi:ribonuclease T2